MQPFFLKSFGLVALLALSACSGGETPTEAPEPAPAVEPNPETPEVDIKELKGEAENVALVPSPLETQRALEASGIGTALNTLIPERKMDLDKADPDHAAVRTGVILADILLTVKSAKKEVLIKRLDMLRKGMNQLDAGKDIDMTLEDVSERIKTDAVTRDELLKEFDELSGVVIPELKFNGKERVVPLIEAGSWLEGAFLVSSALQDAKQPEAAEGLLKSPAVVKYFIKYVKEDGADKAPEVVTQKLDESLSKLLALSEKPEKLTNEDISTVVKVTSDVLKLL